MKRDLTCITCPLGCVLTVEYQDKKVLSVIGNGCPRGKGYAESEIVRPMRTVTTTIMTRSGVPCPVKTDKPIPKEMILECMKKINSCIAPLPIVRGDVIIKDVFGANVVATASLSE